VPGDGTRPIMDRVKTSLFDILRPRIDGMELLDLFAGSGSVGIEALSQGAASCVFTELGHKAVATIRKNLESTAMADRGQVVHTDAFDFLKRTPKSFDLIYIAPPQYKKLWSEAMLAIDARPELVRCLAEAESEEVWPGWIIVQIHPKEYEPLELAHFRETRQKSYGRTLLVFYERIVAGGA
jgi:16S rRNA (guanine966-N2)-methyltransferase